MAIATSTAIALGGRLRDVGVQLDLGEVSGAQLAAKNADELSARAMQQGFQGLTNTAQQALQFAPLYDKQTVDAKGYAVTERPKSGKYALPNQSSFMNSQEQLFAPMYSNPNLNPFAIITK